MNKKTISIILLSVLAIVWNLTVNYVDKQLKEKRDISVYANCHKVWASRGLYNSHSEQNSIISMQRAFTAGALGVEVDFYYDVKMDRSLPLTTAIDIENILIDGVKVANDKKEELCTKLEADNLVRISDEMLTKYLDMYASDESVELSELQLKALDILYELGFKHGLWNTKITTKDYLIPKEYEVLRNS